MVLAGGALAAGGAPALIRFGALFGEGVGPLLIIAAALHALALWAATRLPHAIAPIRLEARPAAASSWRFVAATLGGALGWFLMAAGMLHGPLQLSLCQASRGFIGAAMAWHLLAMYGPAALAARWPKLAPPALSMLCGLAAMLVALGAVRAGASVFSVTAAMMVIGAGWSLVNVGAMRLLHDKGRPPRLALALHDLCLLGAAAAGALAF